MYEVLTLGCTPYRHVLEDKEVPYHVSYQGTFLIFDAIKKWWHLLPTQIA